MDKILLSPPVAFLIMLGVVTLFATTLSAFSLKAKKHDDGEGKSYACGEDVPTHLMQPDYSQFFPFAFFFTVLHVVALMIATVPVETMESFAIAIIYIAGAMVGMVILFRR
jgi:NADH-quinone oxidoreductase subunit A